MDYYALGQRIRKIRKARGLSQETLAEQIGISTTHMSHIETGNTKLSLSVLVDLALALEVRTDDLLCDDGPTKRTAAMDSIAQTLESCTTTQLKIILDTIRAVKVSLEQNL